MGLRVEGMVSWAPGWHRALVHSPRPPAAPAPSGNKWSWCCSTHPCTAAASPPGHCNCHKNSSLAARGMWGARRLSAIPLPAGPASVLLSPPGCISRWLKHHQTPCPF